LTLRYSLLLSVWVDPSAEHTYMRLCPQTRASLLGSNPEGAGIRRRRLRSRRDAAAASAERRTREALFDATLADDEQWEEVGRHEDEVHRPL